MGYSSKNSRFDFDFDVAPAFKEGDILLGYDHNDQLVGVPAEAHCLGIAGTGGGKTTAVMIPNVLATTDNVFCIDPTGKIVESVWQAREARGQKVFVLDPLKVANVPDRLRAAYNPLRYIDPDPDSVVGDMMAIQKAIIMRNDPRSEHWDAGAEALLSGIATWLLAVMEPSDQTLGHMRKALRSPDLRSYIDEMANIEAFGGMAQAGAAVMNAHDGEASHFKSAALLNSMWLDSPSFQQVLNDGDLDLRELKTGSVDVYLVLPPGELDNYSRYLRLMVSLALRAMMKMTGGRRCLFLLDEFFALGKLDVMLKAFAAGRSSGIRCWPFVQDMGQLEMLYGKSGMRSFFANSSLHMFFAVDDEETLKHISDRLGEITVEDLGVNPPQSSAPMIPGELLYRASRTPTAPMNMPMPRNAKGISGMAPGLLWQAASHGIHRSRMNDVSVARQEMDLVMREHQAAEARQKAKYDHVMKSVGRRRTPPDEVKELIGKPSPNEVARSMIVFAAGGAVLNVRPWRFDLKPPAVEKSIKSLPEAREAIVQGEGLLKDCRAEWGRNRQKLINALWQVPIYSFFWAVFLFVGTAFVLAWSGRVTTNPVGFLWLWGFVFTLMALTRWPSRLRALKISIAGTAAAEKMDLENKEAYARGVAVIKEHETQKKQLSH